MGDDDKSLTQYNRDHPKKLRNMEPKLEPDQPDQPHYIAHIPEDILSHVISRMPWRSICRLKCVSMYCVVFTGPAVQMRGSLYWVATRDVVVCCNVEKKFCFIKQPNFKIFSGLINTPCLGEFNGVLRYLASDSRMVCLWDLQAGEWELVKMVPIDTIAKSLSDKYWMIDDFNNVRPLALQCSNPEMVFLAFPHKWIMSYNLVSEEVNLIERIEMSYLILTPMILIPFVLPKIPLPVF
ncbi:uncharacterized protein LOC114310923 [Camellia sinensis]|uniref:uncharacterized protein LOC114310923 n=1 Tax=Camellia sinensis TaxID=4442 RepID=UPI0010356A35|nr:uncharacterized protein LOC114310923 [Camellia sinensis]